MRNAETPLVGSDVETGRIDHQRPAAAERAVPYYCPYCGDEDLRPLGTTPGAWHCRSCTRSFSVRFLGLGPDSASSPAPTTATGRPTATGGSR